MATVEEIGQALRAADAAGNTEDAKRLAGLYASTKSQGSVNVPTSAQSAISARNDLVPQPTDNRYNPNQSIGGYGANEVGKAVTGILGIPEATISRLAQSANPLMPVAALAQRVVPTSMADIRQILGIEQDKKAPGPGTEMLTGLGIEIGQNFMFPGGGVIPKISGGVGSYAGRQMLGEFGPVGELTGSMLGGIVAPALLSSRLSALQSIYKFARESGGNVVEKIQGNPHAMAKIRQDVLNELAQDMRADPATYAAKYAAAQELEQAIPGLKLNLGQTFAAPSVIQRQRALETSSPAEMNAAQLRRAGNEEAMLTVLGRNPAARANAEGAITSLSDQTSAQSRAISGQIAQVQDEAAKIASRVQTADLPLLGQRALDIRASELGKARAKANELMGIAADAAKREGAVFDTSQLVQKAKQIQSEPIWDDANYTSIFGKIKGLGKNEGQFDWNPVTGATPKNVTNSVGFDDIREMRQAVNADIASALRSNSPNARAQLRNLQQLKKEIDGVIEVSPFQATKDAYGAFVNYYKHEFAPRFLRGANLLAEKVGATGEARLPAEKVFSTYFKPNGATEMSRYLKLYGENSDAMLAMRDAITDRYARDVVKNGAIDPMAHAQFMRKYETPLAALDRSGFKFASDLGDTAKAYESVNNRLSALKDASSMADKDFVRKMLTDEFGVKSPEQVIGEIINDPRKTNLLLSRMDNKQAKGVVEFMKDDLIQQFTKEGQIDPAAVAGFLGDRIKVQSYRNAIARVYGSSVADEQVNTLRRIEQAAQRLDETPVPMSSVHTGKPKLGQDAIYQSVGFSARTVWSMIRAAVTGRSSVSDAAVVLGGQALQTVQANLKNEIYKEIIRDPASAKMLLKLMETSPQSGAGVEITKRFIGQVPLVAGALIGARKYPELAKYAAANFAREQGEKEGE